MKLSFILFISAILLFSCEKSENLQPDFYDCTFNFVDSSSTHPHNTEYQALLEDIVSQGVVGLSMAVYHDDDGLWTGAAGMADLHNRIDMQPCNITRVGSTVKMFTASTILLMVEEGDFNLDDRVSDYLSGEMIDKIENANKATIRQLLQHSSGIYNYIQNLQFQTASINDLIREWHAEDLLEYAYDKPAYFAPGTDVRYSNTGYILLGLLIEKIEGKPFYQVFQEKIFDPLQLTMTRFAAGDPVPDGIVRGYIDLYSNLQVIESTYYSGWDYYTADGGLISTPYDLTKFFRSLMNGDLISSESLNEMLSWRTPNEVDSEYFPISYGLGIFKVETPYGIAYLHSGDAIGYVASMMYFPDDSTTIAFAANSNYGKIDEHISSRKAVEKILSIVR